MAFSDKHIQNMLFDGNEAVKEEVFSDMYQKYFVLVYHYAKRFLESTQEIEDIVSESFIKLWERLKLFSNSNGVRAFLLTTTKNACLNQVKISGNVQKREAFFASFQESAESTITKEEVTGELFQYIFDEIAKLPTREREVFTLSYLHNKTNNQIADLLDINNQSVRNYKAKALKTLRTVFKNSDLLSVLAIIVELSRQ